MIEYEYRLIGYHCNYKNRLANFIEKNELCISKDTHYLGDGMYFWDNRHDLEFWESRKKSEAKQNGVQEPILCVTARIQYNTDQLIDLTIKEEFEKLIKIKNIINQAHKNKVNSFENFALGEVINKLFSSSNALIDAYLSNIKVMKVNLRYENIIDGYIVNESNYYSGKLHQNQSFSFDIRTIYCVKDGENIIFHEVLREEVAS